MTPGLNTNGVFSGGNFRMRGSEHFPDPFLDAASTAMPTSQTDAMKWCEFIYNSNGTYREAAKRIVSYFITDVEIESHEATREAKEKFVDFLHDVLDIKSVLFNIAENYMCFAGDTKAVTRDGVYTLRELAGRTVDVLSQGGVYRSAEFKSFGRQQLLEVEFSDGRTLLATPEHQWVVPKSNGGTTRVPTTKLVGRKIERTAAPRPPQDDEYFEGVRHGFTFGDGTLYNDGKQARANFFGEKDQAMARYFEGHGSPIIPCPDNRDLRYIHGLSAHYKRLPENAASASYWYGFVSGFLAADGSVDTYGCTVLTQASSVTLETVAAQLPRLGMHSGPVRGYDRVADFSPYRDDPDAESIYDGPMYYVTLLKQFMVPQDLLLAEHRAKFVANQSATSYGQYIGVKSVRTTGLYDEVFCCVEPETHTFVVDHGILTGNCYGNNFASIRVPFRRALMCPQCFAEHPIGKVYNTAAFNFRWTNFEFQADCQNSSCGFSGPWTHIDRRGGDESDIKLCHWSPHEIEILNDQLSGECAYVWKIPSDYQKKIRDGELWTLERANWEVIQAIKSGSNRMMFDPGVIHHTKDPTLAGLRNQGWGISRIVTNFRQAWYLQVLKRYNEAIALDYVIPFRVITPMPKGGGGSGMPAEAMDPMLGANMGTFAAQINRMLARRRKDPAGWNVIPFPIQYQALGGEATQLAPVELLQQAEDGLLNSIGCPAEMYRGSMTMEVAGPALRLFEANWSPLVHNLNGFLTFLIDSLSKILNWEPVSAKMTRVTHADDAEKSMARLQLMMGRQISQTTGLRGLNLDFEEEQKRMLDEEKFIAEETQKMQETMQEQQETTGALQQGMQGGGGGAPGGDPAAGGGGAAGAFGAAQPNQPNVPTTPEDMLQQAQQIAQQLMGMPEAQKDSELIALKKSDTTLHAVVKSQMDSMRQQAQTAGGAQVMAQQFGKTGSVLRPATIVIPDEHLIREMEKRGYAVTRPHAAPATTRPRRPVLLHGFRPTGTG